MWTDSKHSRTNPRKQTTQQREETSSMTSLVGRTKSRGTSELIRKRREREKGLTLEIFGIQSTRLDSFVDKLFDSPFHGSISTGFAVWTFDPRDLRWTSKCSIPFPFPFGDTSFLIPHTGDSTDRQRSIFTPLMNGVDILRQLFDTGARRSGDKRCLTRLNRKVQLMSFERSPRDNDENEEETFDLSRMRREKANLFQSNREKVIDDARTSSKIVRWKTCFFLVSKNPRIFLDRMSGLRDRNKWRRPSNWWLHSSVYSTEFN